MASSIVKLIPIGNPEDHMFELVDVGGTASLRTEVFTSVSLDGNGEATVTLKVSPTGLADCFVVAHKDERVAAAFSLAGKVLSVRVRKLVYDRAKATIHAGQIVENAVSTIASGAFNTGDTAPGATATGPSATVDHVGGASGDAVVSVGSVSVSVDAHHHSVDALPDHGHTNTYDLAHSLDRAASETVDLLVIYK